MSPSASTTALAALLVLGGGLPALPQADPTATPGDEAGTASPSPVASWDPSPGPTDEVTPQVGDLAPGDSRSDQLEPRVTELSPAVRELRANVRDLGGVARVSSSSRQLDVVLATDRVLKGAAVRPAARPRLAEVARQLKGYRGATVEVVGHTDDAGTPAQALQRSTQQAIAVQQYLASSLNGLQVSVTGRGDADPVAPNTSAENRAQNRRVELHVTRR